MENPLAPLFAAGGFIGLFGAAGVLIVQMLRESARLRKERAAEIAELKGDIKELKNENTRHQAENYACRLQVNSLVTMLQQSGIPLPDWLLRDYGEA